jgi:hypothetical protein
MGQVRRIVATCLQMSTERLSAEYGIAAALGRARVDALHNARSSDRIKA